MVEDFKQTILRKAGEDDADKFVKYMEKLYCDREKWASYPTHKYFTAGRLPEIN